MDGNTNMDLKGNNNENIVVGFFYFTFYGLASIRKPFLALVSSAASFLVMKIRS